MAGRKRLLRHKEILHVPLGELIEGDPLVGGQLTNSAQILTLGVWDQPGKVEVSGHAFSEFCHRDILSCMGPENPGHTGRKLKGIRPEVSGGLFLPVCKTAPDRSPHPAAKLLRPSDAKPWLMRE
jgi:hypothetical protein